MNQKRPSIRMEVPDVHPKGRRPPVTVDASAPLDDLMEDPPPPRPQRLGVPAVDACQKAKNAALEKLADAEQVLKKASRMAVQHPTDESNAKLNAAQKAKDDAAAFVSQCDLAIQDALEEHAEEVEAAKYALTEKTKKEILKRAAKIELASKEASKALDQFLDKFFHIAKECNDVANLAYEANLSDGTLVMDSMLSTNRIIGAFRQHLRKAGKNGSSMGWAYPYFGTEGIQALPDFDVSVAEGLKWLTKFAQSQADQ